LEAPKFKMAAQFKMAANILFTSKTYKTPFLSNIFALLGVQIPNFYIKKFFSKIQDGACLQYGVFLASFSSKKIKKMFAKNKLEMAAKFKMATKTEFSYVEKDSRSL
jgi:hypothetical protein